MFPIFTCVKPSFLGGSAWLSLKKSRTCRLTWKMSLRSSPDWVAPLGSFGPVWAVVGPSGRGDVKFHRSILAGVWREIFAVKPKIKICALKQFYKKFVRSCSGNLWWIWTSLQTKGSHAASGLCQNNKMKPNRSLSGCVLFGTSQQTNGFFLPWKEFCWLKTGGKR